MEAGGRGERYSPDGPLRPGAGLEKLATIGIEAPNAAFLFIVRFQAIETVEFFDCMVRSV